jgi:hypothetical protein
MGGKTMRFLTLVKKELRESLPWMCLASVLFIGFGALLVHADEARRAGTSVDNSVVSWCVTPVSGLGPLLLLTSLGLGLVMGIRQFYVPAFDKTWAFTLHRPVKSSTIVHAKLTAAILGLTLFVGLPWTGMYLYAAAPGRFRFMDPIMPRVLWEGWLLVVSGFVLYLGAAVSSLHRAHWYATKVFSLVFALALILVAVISAPFPAPFVFLGIGLGILGVQVYALMRSQEF